MPHSTEDIPAKQRAIIALPNGDLGISNDVDVPHVDDDLVLVKTVSIAINPVDAKMVGPMAYVLYFSVKSPRHHIIVSNSYSYQLLRHTTHFSPNLLALSFDSY